ncbi:M14 family zinc carboxypeptidase [Virgibacillus sp. YIM 98842]|uniref:FIMAH domain-containing protein n=1 Tax=Virgibacillus sp. YIM 98842 TaxID=2663533 RepID=UPI0013DA69DE|nr:M14 family zinc carboxypeptidase [Virgibacillus sp. YIM 98842]
MTILLIFTIIPASSFAALNDEQDLPTTGFEDRNSGEWTTLEEEIDFIDEVAELSDRVWYEEVGESVDGKPIYMVYVGETERSKEEIQNGRTVFIMGTPHGNEPAGREGAFKILRDLAFTDDPAMLEVLEKSTVLIMPTPNPDGREANTRRNSWGIDNNRDNLNLATPENQTIAKVLRDFSPDITIDAHERPSGSNPDIEYLWPRNLNVDREIYDLNVELIQDYMMPEAIEDGWSTGLYGRPGGSGREDERILRNMGGLRHGLTVLTESAGRATNEDRVSMQLSSYNSVLSFYQERFDEIATAVDGAPVRKQEDGENKADYYLAGADDEPEKEEVIDPPVCGYLLHTTQAEVIERHIDLFELETEQVSDDAVFLTMSQPMMTVVPLLVDDRALYNEVKGLPLEDCTDLESIDPPEPLEETGPAQYETDFKEYEIGTAPDDWSPLWRESNWTVLDEPYRLEHQSIGDQLTRRALTWDDVGEVRGDVEMAAVVRARNTGLSKFQLGFHMSGTMDATSSRNAYYIDIYENGSRLEVRINQFLGGSFSVISRSDLPFTFTEDSWYQVAVQREGNLIHAKVWPFGEEEPEEWQVTAYNGSLDEGKVGLMHLTDGVINDWAYVGIGTGGENAPRAPGDLFDPEVDKTALQDRVDEINAENLNEADYTEESWQALKDALSAAEHVLSDSEATQEEVDTALTVLNDARDGLEEAETEPISAAGMITSIEQFDEEGAFENDQVVRSLTLHLTAVDQYESQGEAEKVVRHMESFILLLDHMDEQIFEEAYNSLRSDAGSLIDKWQ